MDPTVPQGTTIPASPSTPPGTPTTLGTVDIVVLVVYFVLVLAVGLWVSAEKHKSYLSLLPDAGCLEQFLW